MQSIGNGLDGAVLTSDPAVSVSTNLTVIPPDGWQLTVTPVGIQLKGAQVRHGRILIVLSGGLLVAPFAEAQLIKTGVPVKHYSSKLFPWTISPSAATTIEVPPRRNIRDRIFHGSELPDR